MRTSNTRRLLWYISILAVMIISQSAVVCALDDITLWEAALTKRDSGNLAEAKLFFEQLLKEQPTSSKAPGAQLSLARIKFKLTPNSTQELVEAFKLVRTNYPASTEAADALVSIGFLHSRADTTQAIKSFEDFIKQYPKHPSIARVSQSLGRLYLKTLELDKAEASFDRVKSITGVSEELADEAALQSGFVKVMKYYATKDKSHLPNAINALSKLTSSGQINVRARADLGIAECLLLSGKCKDAREKYMTAAQTYSTEPYFNIIALYGAAVSSQQTGKIVQAIDDYAKVLAALPGSTLADKDGNWKSIALANTTQAEQAQIQQDGSWERLQGIGIVQQSVYEQGRCLYLLKRYDEAIKVLLELVQYLPEGNELRVQANELMQRCINAKGGN